MNEVEFRNWLVNEGVKNKVAGDIISRLKRIEKEIRNCDIDEQYRSNRCEHLLKLLSYMGKCKNTEEYADVDLPIGKYYMSTYRYALKKYIEFCDDFILNNQ